MGVKVHAEDGLVLFKDMKKGEIGVIEYAIKEVYLGRVVVSCGEEADKIVGLDGSIWSGLASNIIKVRLLPKGTLLEVT